MNIRLTSSYDGNVYLLNTDHIISYVPREYGRYTEITTIDGRSFTVRETLEQIQNLQLGYQR